MPTPYPTSTLVPYSMSTTTSAAPIYLPPTTKPTVSEEDIKALPAPDILLKAFGLLNNIPEISTSAPLPYDHWEASNDVTSPNSKIQQNSSPLSAIKKLTSAHPTPPSTTLPPVSSRRAVHELTDHYHLSTPKPVIHHSTSVSYSTPSSNVYISKGDQDGSFYHHQDEPPVYVSSTPHSNPNPNANGATQIHFSSTPLPKHHHVEEAPLYYSSTPHPQHVHEEPNTYASTTPHYHHPTPTPHPEPHIVYSAPEPQDVQIESHADPHFHPHEPPLSQYLEVPNQEPIFKHRHSESPPPHHQKHNFHPLPPLDTRITNLPDVLGTLFHHQIEQSTPPSYQYDYRKILDLMKHHGYNPSLTDSSSIKSLPELLEHLNVYKDPHPNNDDEIPAHGLKVKSLPEYAAKPSHHPLQYGGLPVEHSLPGVKSLRPKVKARLPQHSPDYYSHPAPPALPPPPAPPHSPPSYHESASSGASHVSQLHHATYPHYPPQKSQDPGLMSKNSIN